MAMVGYEAPVLLYSYENSGPGCVEWQAGVGCCIYYVLVWHVCAYASVLLPPCVCGLTRARWMSLTALIGRAVSSCRFGQQWKHCTLYVCVCTITPCLGAWIDWVAVCVNKKSMRTCLSSSLFALILLRFFLFLKPRHQLSHSWEGVRCRSWGNSVLWTSTFSSRNNSQNYSKTFNWSC